MSGTSPEMRSEIINSEVDFPLSEYHTDSAPRSRKSSLSVSHSAEPDGNSGTDQKHRSRNMQDPPSRGSHDVHSTSTVGLQSFRSRASVRMNLQGNAALNQMAKRHGIEQDFGESMESSANDRSTSGVYGSLPFDADDDGVHAWYTRAWSDESRSSWDAFLSIVILCNICFSVPFRFAQWGPSPMFSEDLDVGWLIFDTISDFLLLVDIWLRLYRFFDMVQTEKDHEDDDGIYSGAQTSMWDDYYGGLNRRYLYGTFWRDCVASIPLDFLAFVFGARMLPLLRLNKLLRMHRMPTYFSQFTEFVDAKLGDVDHNRWRLFSVWCLTVFIIHFWACMWCFTGHLNVVCENDVCVNDGNWFEFDSCQPDTCSFTRKYIRAMYSASSTIMTVGVGDIRPQNTLETGINLIFLIAGLIICGSVTASFVVIFSDSAKDRDIYQKNIGNLKRYMHAKGLPFPTAQRVLTYQKELWQRQKGMDESALLNQLPGHLRREALVHMLEGPLRTLPFLTDKPAGLVRSMAIRMRPGLYPPMAIMYVRGEKADRLFYLLAGRAGVLLDSRTKLASLQQGRIAQGKDATIHFSDDTTPDQPSFFGERSLFASYTNENSVFALTICDTFQLARSDFQFVVSRIYGDHTRATLREMYMSLMNASDDVREKTRTASMTIMKRKETFFNVSNVTSTQLNRNFDIVWDDPMMPYGRFRLCWGLLIALSCIYTSVFVPVRVAFESNVEQDSVALTWFVVDVVFDIMWLIDVLLRARGFIEVANEQGRPDLIWKRYRRSGMIWVDVLSLLPADYISLAVNGWTYVPHFRFFRLLKVAHAQKAGNALYFYIENSAKEIMDPSNVHLLIILICNLFVFHVGACIWIAIGKRAIDLNEFNWIEDDSALDAGDMRIYVRALYFVIVGFTTTGYGDIRAHADEECIFVALWLLFGVYMYYGSVAAVSIGISQRLEARNFHQEEVEGALALAKLANLSDSLSHRIVNYYNYLWQRQRGVNEHDLLCKLPPVLYRDIAVTLNYGILRESALFQGCSASFVKSVSEKMKIHFYVPLNYIVRRGEVGTDMVVFNRGKAQVRYHQEGDEKHDKGYYRTLEEGSMHGVYEFLHSTPHRADVVAISYCDVSTIDCATLQMVTKCFPAERQNMKTNSLRVLAADEDNGEFVDRHASELLSATLVPARRVRAMLSSVDDKEEDRVFASDADQVVYTENVRWKLMFLVLSLYSAIVIPLRLGFIFTNSFAWLLTDFCLDTLWWLDSYYHATSDAFFLPDGSYENSKKAIWKHYKETRFVTDFVSGFPVDIVPLILYFVADDQDFVLELWAFLRIPKLLRFTRVVQLLSDLRATVQERGYHINPNLINLAALLVAVLLVAHWIGAGLFLLARYEDAMSGANSWLRRSSIEGTEGAYYIKSLYWAMSTITVVCLGDVVVITTSETIYNIFIMLLTFFLIATLVGNVASLFMALNKQEKRLQDQLGRFNEYFRRNHLFSISRRVERYFTRIYTSNAGVDVGMVLTNLPHSLRNEVRAEWYVPTMKLCTLFTNCDVRLIARIAAAANILYYGSMDVIFRAGDEPKTMYVIKSGLCAAFMLDKSAKTLRAKTRRRAPRNPLLLWRKLKAMVLPHHTIVHLPTMERFFEKKFDAMHMKALRDQLNEQLKNHTSLAAVNTRQASVSKPSMGHQRAPSLGAFKPSLRGSVVESERMPKSARTSSALPEIKGAHKRALSLDLDSKPDLGRSESKGMDTMVMDITKFSKNTIRAVVKSSGPKIDVGGPEVGRQVNDAVSQMLAMSPQFGTKTKKPSTGSHRSSLSMATRSLFQRSSNGQSGEKIGGLKAGAAPGVEAVLASEDAAVNSILVSHGSKSELPREEVLAEMGVGGSFGEIGFLLDMQRVCGVKAVTFCECIVFERESFFRVMRGEAEVLRKMRHYAKFRYDESRGKTAEAEKRRPEKKTPQRKVKKLFASKSTVKDRQKARVKRNSSRLQLPGLGRPSSPTVVRSETRDVRGYSDSSVSNKFATESLDSGGDAVELKSMEPPSTPPPVRRSTINKTKSAKDVLAPFRVTQRASMLHAREASMGNITDQGGALALLRQTFNKLGVSRADLDENQDGYLFHPEEAFYQFWVFVILLISYYNALVIPFRIAFSEVDWLVESALPWLTVDYVLDVLFAVDIYMHYRRLVPYEKFASGEAWRENSYWGLYPHDKKVMLICHVLASIPVDILGLFALLTGDSLYVVRVLLWLRMSKVLRVVHIFHNLDACKPMMEALRVTRSAQRFFTTGMVLYTLSHWMACLIIFIGYHSASLDPADATPNWREADSLAYDEVGVQYLRAFYYVWMAMTTVGYGDVSPRPTNIAESVFGCLLIIVATNCFATIVATFESYFVNLDQDLSSHQLFMRYNARYMATRDFPTYLQSRINMYHSYTWTRSKGIDEGALLGALPDTLSLDVALKINRELIDQLPFFEGVDVELLKAVAAVLKAEVCVKADVVAEKGTLSSVMYVIKSGIVAKTVDERLMTLESGDFFGEDHLIEDVPWKGTYVAYTICDLFSLTRSDYLKCLSDFPKYEKVLIWKMKNVSEMRALFRERMLKKRLPSGMGGTHSRRGSVTGSQKKLRQPLPTRKKSGGVDSGVSDDLKGYASGLMPVGDLKHNRQESQELVPASGSALSVPVHRRGRSKSVMVVRNKDTDSAIREVLGKADMLLLDRRSSLDHTVIKNAEGNGADNDEIVDVLTELTAVVPSSSLHH